METGQLVRCVALERDRLLTCGTERHGVGVYDVRRAAAVDRPVWRLLTDRHRRVSVNSLSWSANGHTLACGTQSGLVHLWDVRQPAKEMQVHANQQGSPIQVLVQRFLLTLSFFTLIAFIVFFSFFSVPYCLNR